MRAMGEEGDVGSGPGGVRRYTTTCFDDRAASATMVPKECWSAPKRRTRKVKAHKDSECRF